MIVDPDFLDHWKTRMLVDLLDGDESAPLYVIRLWGHCQTRRNWVFDIPAVGIKALCRFHGDAGDIDNALTTAGFIEREGDQVTIMGWDEHNASLIANWKNGKKGGRPKKKEPKNNPSETHGLPMENPNETHQEPIGGEEIGLDKDDDGQPPGMTQRAITIMNLWNQIADEQKTYWQRVDDPENTSKIRYTRLSQAQTWIRKRLKKQGVKDPQWEDVVGWVNNLLLKMAHDSFYSGRANEYRLKIEQAFRDSYFVDMVEKLNERAA